MLILFCTIGAGCVSCMLRNAWIENTPKQWWLWMIYLMSYAAIDAMVTILLLKPTGRISFAQTPSGTTVLQYGGTAIVVLLCVAVLVVFIEKKWREYVKKGGIKVTYKKRNYAIHSDKKYGLRSMLIGGAVLMALAFPSYLLLSRILPENEGGAVTPLLSEANPSEIMQSTQFSEDGCVTLRGANIADVTGIRINGNYDAACAYSVLSAEDPLNQEISVYIPEEYYQAGGEIRLSVQTVDRGNENFYRSNELSVNVLSNESIPIPEITSANIEYFDMNNAKATQMLQFWGGNFGDDCFIILDGNRRITHYNAETDSLEVEVDYSDWCAKERINFSVGRSYNGYDMGIYSELFPLKVRQKNSTVQDFDYSWTEDHFIAHAFGEVDGKAYTNSLEAFEKNYELGSRVFEVDFVLSADGVVMARSNWYRDSYLNLNEAYSSYERNDLPKDWADISGHGGYTALSFSDICEIMYKHPDMWLVTDTKGAASREIQVMFEKIMADIDRSGHPEILDHIIVQIYNEPMFYQVMDIYPFHSIIYTLYQSAASDSEVIDFVDKTGIGVVTFPESRYSRDLIAGLHNLGCYGYVHTINSEYLIEQYAREGVYGYYSDNINKGNCAVKINKIVDRYFAEATTGLQMEDDMESESYKALKYYLSELHNSRYITALSVNSDASRKMVEELHDILYEYGIEKESLCEEGYSFIALFDQDGIEVQEYGAESLKAGAWIDGTHFEIESVGYVTGAEGKSSIIIDGAEYSKNQPGLNIVVYDRLTGKVIDSTSYDMHDSYDERK